MIGELRAQCEAVTARFEASHGEWKAERERLVLEVRNLRSREAALAKEGEGLGERGEGQSKVHQKLLSQLQQVERSPSGGKLNHQPVGNRARTDLGGHDSHHMDQNGYNGSPMGRSRRVSAITVEREGKVRHLVTTIPGTKVANNNGFVH